MRLSSRFGRNSTAIRSELPLTDDQIRQVAPSIFADAPHESRSARYTYIPTGQVLAGLRKEGFEPFYACQTRTRDSDRRDYTKHMLRLRHASQINGKEAQEIVLLNSHDGSSSYQMLSGVFRFVCSNGMVCGDTFEDIRVPHKGQIIDNVIEGAYTVLNDFDEVQGQVEGMKALTLSPDAQQAFGRAALTLRYDQDAAPITENQLLRSRRIEDTGADLWRTFNRVQENMIRGGLRGRNAQGRATSTREVQGIDSSIKLNRALWVLAEEMRNLIK